LEIRNVRERSNMENMTDKQLEVILNLVADKFQNCKNMEEVEIAVQEIRTMAKKD
jgi:hypothetical protein